MRSLLTAAALAAPGSGLFLTHKAQTSTAKLEKAKSVARKVLSKKLEAGHEPPSYEDEEAFKQEVTGGNVPQGKRDAKMLCESLFQGCLEHTPGCKPGDCAALKSRTLTKEGALSCPVIQKAISHGLFPREELPPHVESFLHKVDVLIVGGS